MSRETTVVTLIADSIPTVLKRNLTRYVGTARREKLADPYRALAIATDCD